MDPSPKRTNPTRMGHRESLRCKVRPDMGVLEGMPPQAVQGKSQQKGGDDEEKEKGGGEADLQDRDTRSGPIGVGRLPPTRSASTSRPIRQQGLSPWTLC